MEKVFTSGEVAKICRVTTRTINQWFNAGLVNGYRLPSKGHPRRFPRSEVVKLLKRQGMSLDVLKMLESHRVLLIGIEKMMLRGVLKIFPEGEDFTYKTTGNAFEAGKLAAIFCPEMVVIDLCLGRGECCEMALCLKADPEYAPACIIGLTGEDDPKPEGLKKYGFDTVFKKPFDVEQLAEHFRSALTKRVFARAGRLKRLRITTTTSQGSAS